MVRELERGEVFKAPPFSLDEMGEFHVEVNKKSRNITDPALGF